MPFFDLEVAAGLVFLAVGNDIRIVDPLDTQGKVDGFSARAATRLLAPPDESAIVASQIGNRVEANEPTRFGNLLWRSNFDSDSDTMAVTNSRVFYVMDLGFANAQLVVCQLLSGGCVSKAQLDAASRLGAHGDHAYYSTPGDDRLRFIHVNSASPATDFWGNGKAATAFANSGRYLYVAYPDQIIRIFR